MLQLHRGLTAPDGVVIGAENETVVRYEDEGIALAAYRASRIGWKQRCAAGAFVVEPPLHGDAAMCSTLGGDHAALSGVPLRRL